MVEYHLPGYNFCGPGTNLEERLARGDKPINELDACCMVHDIVYSQTKDKKARVAADRQLRNCAVSIGIKKETSKKLRAEAAIVAGAMATEPGRWYGGKM
tara:strand:- start:31 stop:330 length:300 start_codon:yes stop_codon:yes gene_type:complete